MRMLNRPLTRTSGREGTALTMALMSVVAVSALVAGFLQLSSAVTRRQSTSSDTKQAFYLAEAGLAEAYTGLAVAHTGNVGSEEQPAAFGGGVFWVEAERTGDLVTLTSTGVYGSGRSALSIVVEPVAHSLSDLGFFTAADLRVNPNTLIDSFDSAIGSYADQVGTPSNERAMVGSNGDVSLSNGDEIRGNVLSGPGGSVDVGTATVSGGSTSMPAAQPLPAIDVPPIAIGPARDESGAAPVVIGPGELGYESLSVGKGSKVIVKGPATMVIGDVTLVKGAELHFETTDGPVDVYVTGDLDLKMSSLVSVSSAVPSDVTFMISSPSSSSVSLGGDSSFYGFIYAPNAEVKMAAKFEVFGGLVAKSLNLAAQGNLHYDVSLDVERSGSLPRYYSWRVVDIPNSLRAKRLRLGMGIDRSSLPLPGEAHEDQLLELEYVNLAGATASFTGKESTFDWSNVREVLHGTRDGLPFEAPDEDRTSESGDPTKDLIADSSLSSSELKGLLFDHMPLSKEAMIAAAERDPPMSSSDLEAVLIEMGPDKGNPQLDSSILHSAIDSAALDSGSLKSLLMANSPLPLPVLQAAIDRVPAMQASDLDAVLGSQ